MKSSEKKLPCILFDTLSYIDKLSELESPYTTFSTCAADIAKGKKPPFLDGKKASGSYEEEANAYREIMYRELLSSDDPLISQFFRLEINTKNFLVWLRCKEKEVSHEGRMIEAGDWRPIAHGQGMDMGFIPERNEIFSMFKGGEWSLLVNKLFAVWRKRLEILASFRTDRVIDMVLTYLEEEESRWTIKAS